MTGAMEMTLKSDVGAAKRIIGAVAIGAAFVMGVGTAHAVPTNTIDGITFPVGTIPLGNQIQSGILDESLITGPGQTLRGVGFVQTIAQGLTKTWQDGNNGRSLYFVFDNYLSTAATAFPVADFTGGTATFYSVPSNFVIDNTSLSNAINSVKTAGTTGTGKVFLATQGAPEDPAGDTLISQIITGSSLLNFTAGRGDGFLDVTGGDADVNFATRTFANAFDSPVPFSDMSLTSDFSAGSTIPGAGVSGSATLKANAVPEPISLGVLGVAMAALGVARRRKR
jgi:hypothetical protein